MRRTHLAIQAAIVLAMVSLVSWPQFRPVHAQTVWRYSPEAVAQAQANDVQRFSGETPQATRQPFRLGSAAYIGTAAPRTAPAVRSDIERAEPFVPPASVTALGGRVNALLGLAKNSLNAGVPYARVVLRTIRTGRVLARTTADSQGAFRFLDLDSDMYVVELLGADGSVVATSATMSLARGDLRQAELRVPATATTVAAVVGNSYTSTLPQATKVAAGTGVTRTTTSQQPEVTP